LFGNVGQVALPAKSFDDAGDEIVLRRRPFAVRAKVVLVAPGGLVERDERLLAGGAKREFGALLGLDI
jgi:hypothetical protein